MKTNILDYAFSNKGSPITLILEPWAKEFIIQNNSKALIKIFYHELDDFEAELSDKYFTIWLWAGCRAQVFVDGVDRTLASFSISAPG